MLLIDNIFFSYPLKSVLKGFSLSLNQGEIGTLIGVSGSGKSTLFKILTGLLNPQQGSLSLGNNYHSSISKQISYMMQDDLLLPWRTLKENVLLSIELGKGALPTKLQLLEIYKLLEELGLKGWEECYPDQLSGGMRQRASLARALLQKRPLLLLDQPFGGIDVIFREHLYSYLRNIRDKYRTTILMVTHDFRDALSLSDRIFYLNEGKIQREWLLSNEERQNFSLMGKLQEEFISVMNLSQQVK